MPEDQNSPAPADEPKPQPPVEQPKPAAAAPAPEPAKPQPAPSAPVAPAAAAKVVEPEPEEDVSNENVGGTTPEYTTEYTTGIEGPADTRNAQNVYAAGDVIAYVAPLGTAAPSGFAELTSATWGCLGWLDTAGGIFNLNHTTKDIGAAGTLSSIRTIFTGGNKTLQVTCLEALNPCARALYDDVPISTLTPASRVDSGCGTTLSSVTVTDANITAGDVGSSVSGTGIPTGATIVSVTAGTSFTLSAAATATGSSVSLTISAGYSEYVIPEIPQDNRYCLVLDSIDGENQIRMFAPMAKVTARGNDQIQQGDSENLQMTFTFFPALIGSVRGSLQRYINYGSNTMTFTF
jgi:hypothetical protein